jgi:uncharacterized protein (TIGR00730 family)
MATSDGPARLRSVGLFCGSSPGVEPAWAEAASRFGTLLAESGVRLVYGGGAVGLMGACARAVVAGGGRPLGVIPEFLSRPEVAYEAAELVVVGSMHERKAIMFREAEGFAVLPGGIGTLEEVIELLSWARLGLHAKPVVFLNALGFWSPLFELIEHTLREGFTPREFSCAYRAVERPEDILPALAAMAAAAPRRPDMPLIVT